VDTAQRFSSTVAHATLFPMRAGHLFRSWGARHRRPSRRMAASGTREYGAVQRSRGALRPSFAGARPPEDRGRGESRVLAAPAASHAKWKSIREV